MRYFIISAGAIAALALSASIASAQENAFSMSKPMAAPSQALELKVGTGYTQGFGRVSPTRSMPDVAGVGLGVGLDVDYRVNPRWSVGLEGQYQELSAERNASSRGLAGNLGATYHFAPMQVGDPFLRLGTGYRFLWENNPEGTTGLSVLRHGFDLASAKIGYDFRASEDVALAPVVGADVNMFVWEKAGGAPNATLSSAQVATFIYVGIQGPSTSAVRVRAERRIRLSPRS